MQVTFHLLGNVKECQPLLDALHDQVLHLYALFVHSVCTAVLYFDIILMYTQRCNQQHVQGHH